MQLLSITILMVIGLTPILAQADYTFGLMPRVNFGYKLTGKASLKSSIESRQGFYDSEVNDRLAYDNILTDYSLFYSRKIGPLRSLNIGYMARVRSSEVIHRVSQHFNWVKKINQGRLGHRLAFDQTGSRDRPIVFRARYRITIERSLIGDRIDRGELYIKVGQEALFEQSTKAADLEYRLVPMLGFELSSISRFEVGLDMRFSGLVRGDTAINQWLRATYYYSLR